MKTDLSPYRNMRICVAVSGGRDSMALLRFLSVNAADYGIKVSAMNCDHRIRVNSADDSGFVVDYCRDHGIPCLSFVYDTANGPLNETRARLWRHRCFLEATVPDDKRGWEGADAVATAHHLEDNAETVIFNLCRGSGLSGMCGIRDDVVPVYDDISDDENFSSGGHLPEKTLGHVKLIRPLISVSSTEIEEYVKENGIPYVTDETNLTDDYTRNKIRHGVLPTLEEIIPGALRGIERFSEICAETDEYLDKEVVKKLGLVEEIHASPYVSPYTSPYDLYDIAYASPYASSDAATFASTSDSSSASTVGGAVCIGADGFKIFTTDEKVLFSRAALYVFSRFGLKDYTSEHIESLFELQSLQKGKKFEFLGLRAVKEDGYISVLRRRVNDGKDVSEEADVELSFSRIVGGSVFCGQRIVVHRLGDIGRANGTHAVNADANEGYGRVDEATKMLRFDIGTIPSDAVVRHMREGDLFTKFGGGTKKLGDYFTDRKIPVRLRSHVPIVASGGKVLIVCGVEISDDVKVTPQTTEDKLFVMECADYTKIK